MRTPAGRVFDRTRRRPGRRLRPASGAARAAVAVLALALVTSACAVRVTPSSASTSTTIPPAPPVATVGATPLGVNVAAWDALYTGAQATAIDAQLDQAGLRLLRYPGGSWADHYDWTTTTDSSTCVGAVEPSCTKPDQLSFDTFSSQARAAHASSLVTVDYGSGTPTQAAQWVTHAATGPTTSVDLWEVGNEDYSCYETNLHLAQPPTSIHDYTPGGSYCPSTRDMTRSYVVHAAPYLRAMKAADPRARIGVPWAFTGAEADGAGVADADTWNTGVLRAFHRSISFVDAHWYPIDQVAGYSDQQILDTVRTIAPAAAHLRSVLHRDAPRAGFVVGETNITERLSTKDFEPVAALFAAATSLEWLAEGAKSVEWWDLNNYGSPTTGDYGLLSSGSPEPQAAGTPYPAYFGEELASMLAAPGSRLTTVGGLADGLLGFRSDLGGRREVLLVNPGVTARTTPTTRWFGTGTTVQTSTYSAATAATPTPIVTASGPTPARAALPASSIVVLSGTGPKVAKKEKRTS